MGFHQRWGFAALIVATFFIVFFTFDPVKKRHCHCRRCPTAATPFGQTSTHSELLQAWKERHRTQAVKRPEFKKDGWILDCITWNNKWELPAVEAEPHEFLIEENLNQLEGEAEDHRNKAFLEIYHKQYWHAKDPTYFGLQASGPGALLKNAQSAIAALHIIVTKLKLYLGKPTISILDVGCGDLQWMNKFLVSRDDVEYLGIDIVPHIIESHKKQFANLPNTKFLHLDMVTSTVNDSYDLVVCRDTLQYLTQADVLRALSHISESGSKFLLATSFPDTTQNGEIRQIPLKDRKFTYNLELPPFLLESPICTNYDWNVAHLHLWTLPVRQKYEY